MHDDDYRGLQNLLYFKKNDIFPFHNQKIDSDYQIFCEKADEFISDFFSLYSFDGIDHHTWRPKGDGYVSDEIFGEIMGKIAKLDRKASLLADLWEEFINAARQELKGASKVIEPYE